MPNTVLGDASRLIPDPIARTLEEKLELDQGSVTITAVVYRSTSGKSTDPAGKRQASSLTMTKDIVG